MTMARPTRRGEVPRFGSVWTWGEPVGGRTQLMALGVKNGPFRANLIALVVGPLDHSAIFEVDPHWVWSDHGIVLDKWTCIDEGPDL